MRGRRWHPSQQITELPGGGMRVSFHLDKLEEIEQWVLSWGAHATVVRPQALADRLLATSQFVVSKYQSGLTTERSGRQQEFRFKRH